jgi:hypothetical protein
MSRIAPGNLRSSSKARAFSALISFGEDASVPPPVLAESMLVVAGSVLSIPVSDQFSAADGVGRG